MSKTLVTLRDVGIDARTPVHRDSIGSLIQNLIGRAQGLERRLLQGIDLKIQSGDVIGIIGPNGSGKSTLCKVIAGALSPSRGTVDLQCHPRALTGMTFRISENLTGWENALSIANLIYPDRNPGPIAEEAIAFSQLEKARHHPIRTYSLGMRTRLVLSLVSALPAPLLILDEVFGGADATFRRKIMQRFRRTVRQSGAALIVSHNFRLLEQICNHLLVLDEGKLVFRGAPDDAIAHYRKRFSIPLPKPSAIEGKLPKS